MSASAGTRMMRSLIVKSRKLRPFRVQRSVKNALEHRQEEHRRHQQARHCQDGRPGRQREQAFEDQELAHKAVQSRQAQR